MAILQITRALSFWGFISLLVGCAGISYPTHITVTEEHRREVDELLAKYPRVNWFNPDINAYFNEMLKVLTDGTLSHNQPFRFYIFNSLTINAFALPDGTILLSSGLLLQLDDPNDLAAILAHEIAHVALQHQQKQQHFDAKLQHYARQTSNNSVASQQQALRSLLLSLQYSRTMELEADRMAHHLLTRSGLSTRQYQQLLKKFTELPDLKDIAADSSQPDENGERAEADGESEQLQEILSTHPKIQDRVALLGTLPPSNADYAFPRDPYRALVGATPLIRSYASAIHSDGQIYLRDREMMLAVEGDDLIQSFTIDSGKLLLAGQLVNVQVLDPSEAEHNMKAFVDRVMFGYLYDPGRLDLKGEVTIQGRSRFNEKECLDLLLRPAKSTIVATWMVRAAGCRVSARPLMNRLRIEALDQTSMADKFAFSLKWKKSEEALTGAELNRAASVSTVAPGRFYDWLNLLSDGDDAGGGKRKVLQ